MPNVDCVLEIEMRDHRSGVVSVVIHVVTVADLRGAAMAAPVMGDDAIAPAEEEEHLRVPSHRLMAASRD
jgi:hypothetical protein